MATELALEFVDRQNSVMAFPLQDTKRDQTTSEMMLLSSFGAGLTAIQPELILTDADDLFNLRADLIESAHLRGRQRQAMGATVGEIG